MENASYFSYDITVVKIKGFLWHGTEWGWYKYYIIWLNKAKYRWNFFSSPFMNNQYYIRNVWSGSFKKKYLSHIFKIAAKKHFAQTQHLILSKNIAACVLIPRIFI